MNVRGTEPVNFLTTSFHEEEFKKRSRPFNLNGDASLETCLLRRNPMSRSMKNKQDNSLSIGTKNKVKILLRLRRPNTILRYGCFFLVNLSGAFQMS